MATCCTAPGNAHRFATPSYTNATINATRTTWLKLSVRGIPVSSEPLALYGIRIKTDGTIAVYVNGQLVHRAQEQGPLWNSTRTSLWVVLKKMHTTHH